MPVAQHQRALVLQVPHDVRHRVLGRYPQADVYVVDADAALDDLAAGLPLRQLSDYPANLGTALPVEHLAPVLRYPDYVVDAVPSRVC